MYRMYTIILYRSLFESYMFFDVIVHSNCVHYYKHANFLYALSTLNLV